MLIVWIIHIVWYDVIYIFLYQILVQLIELPYLSQLMELPLPLFVTADAEFTFNSGYPVQDRIKRHCTSNPTMSGSAFIYNTMNVLKLINCDKKKKVPNTSNFIFLNDGLREETFINWRALLSFQWNILNNKKHYEP